MLLALSQYLLHCSGLEQNPQLLQGMPVLQRDGNENAYEDSEDNTNKIIYNKNQKTF